MIKQKEVRSNQYRGQADKVFQQEEAVSKAFQISNFYTNQRLNITELKQRLEQFKHKQKNALPPPQSQSMHDHYKRPKLQKQQPGPEKFKGTFGQLPDQKEKISLPIAHRQRLSYYEDNARQNDAKRKIATPDSDYFGKERIQEVKQTNYRIVKQIKRYEGLTRTAQGVRQHMTLVPVISNQTTNKSRASSKIERSRVQNLNTSKCSNSSNKKSFSSQTFWLQGLIVIQSKQQLVEFQKEISMLWQHYQLLTKILMGLKEGTKNEKNAIVKYLEDVCSNRFQFVRDLLLAITRQGAQKNQYLFVKRLRKSIILSRLLENLALLYVGYSICTQKQLQTHLVNFVGYCCSNIAFLIRFTVLMHSLTEGMKVSAPVSHIIEVIDEFQEISYNKVITRVNEIVLRMQQNNDVINIVQSKLCNVMDKQFQKIITTFLKYVDLDSKPLYEYSHYIYQFLAFYLAKKSISGQFSFLEMAPSPYIDSSEKPKTIIIQPWQVLIAQRGKKIFVRSYTDTVLNQAIKYCNIIYWTDLMPDIIDPLMEHLPPGKVLYRYHCRYENDRYLKLLWRLGCDNDNTIIIDRDEANFKYDKDMGVALPWQGQRKDKRLLQFFQNINQMLSQNKVTFRRFFLELKRTFEQKEQKAKGRKSVHSSEQRDDLQSKFPQPMPKKGVNRLRNYQY